MLREIFFQRQILLALLAGLLMASAQAADAWQGFPIAEGKFSVKFPARPACETRNTGNGLAIMTCSVSAPHSEMVVMVTRMDTEGRSASEIDSALTSGMAGAAQNVQGEVVDPRDVTVHGVKGKEFTVKTRSGVIIQRMLIGDGYIVQAMAMPSPDSAAARSEIQAFVSSLAPTAK